MPTLPPALGLPIYAGYAAFYDRTGQMRFSILMDMYLREALARHPAPGRRALDLACGTGTLALLLAESGWTVVGLDRAPAMLDEARRKRATSGLAVAFVEGDMRDFALEHPVDLVTCAYDSLNYLLVEDDLLSCFRSVSRALTSGGLFCFDLATDFFLQNYWHGAESYQDDGYTQVMESSWDAVQGWSTLALSGVIEVEPGVATSFQELHIERPYAPDTVERLLRAAGLRPVALYDCFSFTAPNERSLRHFWVARKDAEPLPNAVGF